MHITLTGNLGSGKSTITRILSQKYGYEIFSTGKILRDLAEERGVSILEMNRLIESDPSYDHLIDDTTTRISLEKKEDILIDSRLAWHFAVNTFKVFLTVDIGEAAMRVYSDNRGDVEKYSSPDDAKKQLLERAHAEDRRYKELYGLDYFNISNYNLILDSTCSSPDTLGEMILSEKKKYEDALSLGHTPAPVILLSPARLLSKEKPQSYTSLVTEADTCVSMQIEGFKLCGDPAPVVKAYESGSEFVSLKHKC